VSLAGQTSVAELGEVLAGAVLCVCVDSLAYELAQSAGTPTVVLAGESRTRPDVAGKGAPIVVNRTSPELRTAILDCKLSHAKAAFGGCLDWSCPMAGLRSIRVDEVLATALARLEATPRVVAGTAGL
jgi:ADP-heptose:LPS heptosyltransferase